MSHMSDKEIDRIVENEKEWRKVILRRMEKFEETQQDILITSTVNSTKLSIKSGFFGFIGGMIGPIIALFTHK